MGSGLQSVIGKLVGGDVRLQDTLTNVVILMFDIKLQKPDSALQQLVRKEGTVARLLDWSSGPRDERRPRGPLICVSLHFSNVAKSEEGLKCYILVDHSVSCNYPMHVTIVQVIKEVHTPSGTYTGRVSSREGGYKRAFSCCQQC